MEQESTQNKYLIPMAIIVAGAFIAAAIYYGGSAPNKVSDKTPSATITVPPVTDKDHIIGSKRAPIVIVEYSDTECPFCKTFHYTMKNIIITYGDKVAWVYRHFPIVKLHARAAKEAEATECAAELGGNEAFWKYIDEVFERTNSNDTLDPAELPKIALDIGLNEEQFSSCLESNRYSEYILKSAEEAIKAGARGTPYSIIITEDGKKVVINGAEPIESIKSKIDALLK